MANEIWTTYDEGNVLYALIWRKTDNLIWGNVAKLFQKYLDSQVDEFAVLLTNGGDLDDSDYYSVDFPVEITDEGTYQVQVMLQTGGAISADDDFGIAQGELYWNGTSEDTLISISGQMDRLSAQGSRVLNKYPTRSQPDR